MIFPALHNGPINYYARLIRQEKIVLEQYDNYTRQTYRNRCMITGPNGLITLSVPVKKVSGVKTHFRDIRIDYDSPWNRNHWRSLVAAYAASPFFEFVADDLHPLYQEQFDFLFDLNHALLECTFSMLGLVIPVSCTDSFLPITSEEDPRHFIHPNKQGSSSDADFQPADYHQVFSDRIAFRPNLSILDLIFNEGPETVSYLKDAIKT